MSSEGGGNVDDIWNSMKSLDSDMHEEYRMRANNTHKSSVTAAMELLSQKQKAKSKPKKKDKTESTAKSKVSKKKKVQVDAVENIVHNDVVDVDDVPVEKEEVSCQEFMQKISRDINLSESPNAKERVRALSHIYELLTDSYTLSVADYSELFGEICRPIFKRYADSSEKSRDLAFRISIFLFEKGADFVPVLGYFIPALLQRAPATLAYDADMQVFVWDAESHDAFRRGRAVDRQDRPDITKAPSHMVVELSEEVRLLTCRALTTLIRRVAEVGAQSVLNPYFSDVILFLQAQVRDPFPDLKVESAQALEFLALQREYEEGMCYFAVALVRSIMPLFRHRHAKVRAPAVDALKACMSVPNRAKRKGAGTDAICELVGFKEDNVLQVAAFYKTEVSVNYLAEITSDASVLVRERVGRMLSSFLTELDDRYDHQTRLLPYLLDLLGDENSDVQNIALNCLKKCGVQYEDEHHDEIIERRQYGIDGDDRCNLEKPLPAPFTERPRIGIRTYVRGNTKRFIFALVGELTNWQSKTRLKSAKLLKYIIVLCEEYLTMEAHKLIPSYIKALGFAREDKDKELESLLCEICELSGRYTAPESYVHYILPRLRGDTDIVQFGVDSKTRCCVMTVLKCMLEGSKASLIPALLPELIDTIVDPYVIDIESINVHSTAIELMNILLSRVQGKGLAATEAHFQTTGRLKSMKDSITRAFRFLVLSLHKSETRGPASTGLTYLSVLDFDTRVLGVPGLFARQLPTVVGEVIASAGDGDDFEVCGVESPEFQIVELALACPWRTVQKSEKLLTSVLRFLERSVSEKTLHRLGKSSGGMTITESSGLNEPDELLTTLLRYSDLLLASIKSSNLSSMYEHWPSEHTNGKVNEMAEISVVEVDLQRRLCDVFVLCNCWSNDSRLQDRRLEVLSSLLQYSKSNHSFDKDAVFDVLGNKALNLFQNVLMETSSASTPVETRKKSSQLVHGIVLACAGARSVVPFQKQTQPDESPEFLDHKGASTVVLQLLMNISLDDSSDEIRVNTLETLMYLVPYISKSGDGENGTVAPSHTFEGIVDRLLHRIVDGNPLPAFLDMLDYVLRSIAVLCPGEFEDMVRSNMKLLSGVHKAPSPASEIFSGLVDHCDMLIQFSSK